MYPGIHTATTSPYLVTRQNCIVASFSDAKERSAPRHLRGQDKSVFSDGKKSVFGDAQKTCLPRHPHSHDESVFSDTAKLHRCIVQ